MNCDFLPEGKVQLLLMLLRQQWLLRWLQDCHYPFYLVFFFLPQLPQGKLLLAEPVSLLAFSDLVCC